MDDLIIIAVYSLVIASVTYQAINSLEDRTLVRINQTELDTELEEKGLADILKLGFGFKAKDRYGYDKQPNSISLTIENLSDLPLQVNWGYSTLRDVSKVSHRVVRVTPDKRLSLWLPQAPTVIAPHSKMSNTVTTENHVQLNDDGFITEMLPFVDAKTLSKSKDTVLAIALRLNIQLPNTPADDVCCLIETVKLPWTDHLPIG
jgi:hypothetical protein